MYSRILAMTTLSLGMATMACAQADSLTVTYGF